MEKVTMVTAIRSVLIGLICVLLSSCQSTPHDHDFKDVTKLTAPWPQGKGGVVMTTVKDQSDLPDQFISVSRADDPSVAFKIDNMRSVRLYRNIAVFGGFLSPGKYRLMGTHYRFYAGRTAYSGDVKLMTPMEFEVRVGEVFDLGTFVLNKLGSEQARLSQMTAVSLSGDSKGFVKKLFPGVYEKLKDKQWVTNEIGTRSFSQFQPNSGDFSKPVVTKENWLFAGSSLGQILLRKPDGHWQRVNTGKVGFVDLLATAPEGVVASIGDEYEMVYLTKDLKVEPVDMSGLPKRSFDYLSVSNEGHIVVSFMDKEETAFYMSPSVRGGNWKRIYSRRYNNERWLGGVQNWYTTWKDKIYFAEHEPVIRVLDMGSGELSSIAVGKDICAVNISPDGKMVATMPNGFAGASTVHVSNDFGKSWLAIEALTQQSQPIFFDKGRLGIGMSREDLKLVSTYDEGATWEHDLRIKEYPKEIMRTEDGRLIFVVAQDDWAKKVYVSEDKGKHWKLEFDGGRFVSRMLQ